MTKVFDDISKGLSEAIEWTKGNTPNTRLHIVSRTNKKKYLLQLEKSNTGYAGHFPELPTILVADNTIKQTIEQAKRALEIYLDENQRR